MHVFFIQKAEIIIETVGENSEKYVYINKITWLNNESIFWINEHNILAEFNPNRKTNIFCKLFSQIRTTNL